MVVVRAAVIQCNVNLNKIRIQAKPSENKKAGGREGCGQKRGRQSLRDERSLCRWLHERCVLPFGRGHVAGPAARNHHQAAACKAPVLAGLVVVLVVVLVAGAAAVLSSVAVPVPTPLAAAVPAAASVLFDAESSLSESGGGGVPVVLDAVVPSASASPALGSAARAEAFAPLPCAAPRRRTRAWMPRR